MESPISRFQAIDDRIATAAQPTPGQFAWLREQGFDAVLNLSTPTARNFLADESRLAMEAGLDYVHAPVDCARLVPAHYELVRGVLAAFEGRKVLVHCAGNVKSSALVQLWRMNERGEDRERLTGELRALDWHEPKWFDYLERMGGVTPRTGPARSAGPGRLATGAPSSPAAGAAPGARSAAPA